MQKEYFRLWMPAYFASMLILGLAVAVGTPLLLFA
jgi:hypothetical protein